jgi:phage shock protein E
MAKDLSALEASELIEEQRPVILDVRTAQEFRTGHIKGAINLDIMSDFQSSVSSLDKTKTYLVYCRSGNRSRPAISILESMGFKNIFHMESGTLDWQDNNLPLV